MSELLTGDRLVHRSPDSASAIAKVLPEFAPRVPPMRKLWMTEDHRMGMSDALSLVFTYYAKEHIRPG